MEPLCELLSCPDMSVVLVVLEGVENIMRAGEALGGEENKYAQKLGKLGGIERLEELQNHPVSIILSFYFHRFFIQCPVICYYITLMYQNTEIYEKALNILETYFGAEEVEEDPYELINQHLQNLDQSLGQLHLNSFAPGLIYLMPGVFNFDATLSR